MSDDEGRAWREMPQWARDIAIDVKMEAAGFKRRERNIFPHGET